MKLTSRLPLPNKNELRIQISKKDHSQEDAR